MKGIILWDLTAPLTLDVAMSVYITKSLALKILGIKYLQECLVFPVLIANKPSNFISLYRSPSEPTDIFDQFADNLEII